jgi:hypothetical protein
LRHHTKYSNETFYLVSKFFSPKLLEIFQKDVAIL